MPDNSRRANSNSCFRIAQDRLNKAKEYRRAGNNEMALKCMKMYHDWIKMAKSWGNLIA